MACRCCPSDRSRCTLLGTRPRVRCPVVLGLMTRALGGDKSPAMSASEALPACRFPRGETPDSAPVEPASWAHPLVLDVLDCVCNIYVAIQSDCDVVPRCREGGFWECTPAAEAFDTSHQTSSQTPRCIAKPARHGDLTLRAGGRCAERRDICMPQWSSVRLSSQPDGPLLHSNVEQLHDTRSPPAPATPQAGAKCRHASICIQWLAR